MSYILTYGSLRKDNYNYEYFKSIFKSNFEYISTTSITGYKLYSLGSYPAIKETGNVEDVLVVDLIQVSDHVKQYIDDMEFGAGYKIVPKIIQIEGSTYPCEIYVYRYDVDEQNLVESGDWTKFLKKEKSY